MKKYIFLAASALTLASCSSDDFLGDTPGSTPTSANSAIKFDGNAGKISRATSNTATTTEGKLDYQFKIYGVKKTAENKYSEVFGNYSIWWNTTLTTSNTKSWEYVGKKDNSIHIPNTQTTIDLAKDQTIKYWDYASDNYHFVAGSPIANFTYVTNDNGNIESATVSGLGGHITANSGTTATTFNPIYVAEPKVVAKANYKELVQFNFVRQQSMVRVGIYETIPGYSISSIKFYKYADDGTELSVDNDNYIILTSATADYFYGGTDINGTIIYDWTKTPAEYTFSYTDNSLTKSKNWYGGKFASGVPATASTATNITELYGTDGDMLDNGYFTVLPTPSETEAQPILIKCNYTLSADDHSGETIEVTGATAAIPAAYSKWEANTRYTYLFKISDKTNGYTGTNPDKTGLYPITFDAVVKDEKQGTITTIATPSITTYQANSVVENSGIKYVTNKEIKVTVTDNTNGDIKTLSEDDSSVGYVAVYKLSQARTEADLQIKNIKTSELTSTNSKDVTLATDKKSFTFTPDVEGYYAIQYLTTAATEGTQAAYTYKVVYVAAN